jgi:alanyl-tRNA synthetase
MTKDSVEFCGGTHARSLGEIGLFKILSEGGVAAGVRRIEAATGLNALHYVRDLEQTVKGAARLVKAAPNELEDKLQKLVERERALEKELAEAKRKAALGGTAGTGGGNLIDDIAAKARDIPNHAGAKMVSARVEVTDPAMLREVAEKVRDKLGEAVVLVGAQGTEKAQLVCAVSKGLTQKLRAGDLIKPIAQIVGGSGGGRPDMAQAGGTQVDKLDEALAALYTQIS